MDHPTQRELAKLLAALRREGRQQSGLDARLAPPDKAAAYRVAELVAEELGWTVGGWKIAAMKEEMQKALRTDSPIYGRVFSQFIKATPLTVVHATLASPIPEVEYQARLRRFPSSRPGTGGVPLRARSLFPATARHPGRWRRLRHDPLRAGHR
jgi:2-keto-4-pentenoate hydratase